MDEGLIERIRQSIQTAPSQPQQSAPAPAPAATEAPSTGLGQSLDEVAQGNRDTLKTIGNVVVGGARDALQGTWDTASAIAPDVSKWADDKGLNVLGLPTMQEGDKLRLPEVPKADEGTSSGVAANVVRDLERVVIGFIGGGLALRGLGVATNTFRGATAAGALGDFLVTGADDKRLVDLFDAVPALQGPFLEAMQTDGNDNLWKHKLAAAGEGVIFGGAIEGLTRFVGSLRKVKVAQETGDPKAIQKALDEELPEMQASLKEIQAWHGSPHDFEEFDLSKAFSGEGTQAFGAGVYVAENKATGAYYQALGGQSVKKTPEQWAKEWLDSFQGDRARAANDVGSQLENPREFGWTDGEDKLLQVQKILLSDADLSAVKVPTGNLYGVKVKHAPEELLDWNAPFSEQPEAIKKSFVSLADQVAAGPAALAPSTGNFVKAMRGEAQTQFNLEEMSGEQVYRALSVWLGGDEAASKALLEAGVPGLRFLDAGSRDAGEGTRNMVLFDAKSAEIISKNGEPVAPKRAPISVSPSGQVEMFPEVVRREEAIQDIQLQIKGDRYIDPETGKEKILPISNRAREELIASVKDPSSPVHLDKLSPETRDELLRALSGDAEAARFFAPKTVRGKPFALDDTRRADFDAALERSLTIPYATLRASNPGVAIEDTLSTFFNYRYMDSADTVKGSLDQLAEVMKPMVDKHVGGFPQTFDQVREMADWLNMKPDTLTALLSQQARAAEYMPSLVVAGKTWIQSLTRDIHQISKSIAAGTATDTAKVELARRQDILADLIGTLKAVQTSSARTTSAGRIRTADALTHEEIATLVSEIGEDSFKVLSRKLNLTDGNPKAIISILEPTFGQKAWGVLNEGWINGLLSGLGTHIVNFVGGTRNTLLYPSFRFVGGALTGDVRSMKIAMGQYAGLKDALFGSIEMAWRSLKTENSYVDASFHQIERERTWIKAETFGQNGGDTLGQAIDFLGTAVRMPGRFLTSSDEFLKQMNYRASVHARARVEAYERGLSDEKLVPYFVDGEKRMISEVDEYVLDRKNEAFHPRLEHGTDQAALKDARTATFTQPLKEATWYNGPTLGEKLQQVAAEIPPVRHAVLPFVRVPVNIFREMIYESPAAPLRAQFWQDMKAGGEARSDAIGRFTMGSLFWTGTAMLAAEGIITGKGPTDPVLQAQWKLDGKQQYSIKFAGMGENGKDLWVDYSRLGDQWAGMLGIAADAAYVMAHVDERTQDQLAMTLTLSLANNLNSRGYLRSLTELSAVLSATGNPQGPGAVQRWLNSRAASYVPRVVDSLNPDDTMRDARTMIESIYARVPGLSSTLEAKVDNFGVPMAPQVGWPINEINPFKVSMTKLGSARKELSYWADSPVRAQFEIPSSVIDGVVDLRQFKNSETGQTAWGRWMQLLTEPKFGGVSFEERMNEITSSDGYKALKAQGKEDPIFRKHPAVEFLRKQMGDHYEVAQKMMLAEPGFEELQAAMGAYEANKRAVPVGGERIADPALDELLKKR